MRIQGRMKLGRAVNLALLLCLLGWVALLPGCSHKNRAATAAHGGHVFVKNLDPPEAFDLIRANKGNPGFVILDVRTPAEFARARIGGAVNLNYYSPDFRKELAALDKEKAYMVYCRSGWRSGETFEAMKSMGFKTVYQISGGLERWVADDLPVVSNP